MIRSILTTGSTFGKIAATRAHYVRLAVIRRSSNSTEDPCGLSGKWKNELGSTMEIKCIADQSPSTVGTLTGRYNSKVGEAECWYPLSGRYTMVQSNSYVGFSVAWNNDVEGNSESVTSWTGVYHDNTEKISTFWILTSRTDPEDKWENSNIGQDTFQKLS